MRTALTVTAIISLVSYFIWGLKALLLLWAFGPVLGVVLFVFMTIFHWE